MPEKCPNEIIPHILAALEHRPGSARADGLGLSVRRVPGHAVGGPAASGGAVLRRLVHACRDQRRFSAEHDRLDEELPCRSLRNDPKLYGDSILVTTAPDAGSPMDEALLRDVEAGGRVLLYGPLGHASTGLLKLLNLRLEEPIAGQTRWNCANVGPTGGPGYPSQMQHRPTMSAGGCREVLRDAGDPATRVIAMVLKARTNGWRPWRGDSGGEGSSGLGAGDQLRFVQGGHLLTPTIPSNGSAAIAAMRFALDRFGYRVAVRKKSVGQAKSGHVIARHDNGASSPATRPTRTWNCGCDFPGAPMLTGLETELAKAAARYRMPRAWHRECRVSVEQSGRRSCLPGAKLRADGITRRLLLTGSTH